MYRTAPCFAVSRPTATPHYARARGVPQRSRTHVYVHAHAHAHAAIYALANAHAHAHVKRWGWEGYSPSNCRAVVLAQVRLNEINGISMEDLTDALSNRRIFWMGPDYESARKRKVRTPARPHSHMRRLTSRLLRVSAGLGREPTVAHVRHDRPR